MLCSCLVSHFDFLVVGLLTEFWTGQSIPDQIFTMLRVGSFIGPDGF